MTSTFLLFTIDPFHLKKCHSQADGAQINCLCQVNISNRSYIEGHSSLTNGDTYGN